jgi:predicted DNA-binding mobile mystery protein A
MKSNQNLRVQQLNDRMKVLSAIRKVSFPPTGWVKAIRLALGISLQQLGNKLGVSKQNVQNMEKREQEGTVSIKALKEVAHAMDMEFVYGFLPKDGTLNDLIEKRALKLATEIVMRTAHTMSLEDQANSKKRIARSIKERTEMIKNEMPSMLWD